MGYPANYLTNRQGVVRGDWITTKEEADRAADTAEWLERLGLVATRECSPFGGQIARVRIDAYGESASEVEATLMEYAERCDAASQASECSYGACVIERNLLEEWGAPYSWRGRIVLHPAIGTLPSTERAVAALEGKMEALGDPDPS